MDTPEYRYVRRKDLPPKDEPELIGPDLQIGDMISNQIPVGQLFNDTMISIAPFMRGYYIAGAARADEVIFTQSVSDLNSLFHELAGGHGRSASRTARTLIENAINMRWVLTNQGEAQRYVEQIDIAPKIELSLTETSIWPSNKVARRLRSKAAHEYKKAKTEVEAILAKHGPRFLRTWTDMTLVDRASRTNLSYLYEAYRALSQVTHGSSGAVLGLRRQIQGNTVVRTGPDLSACPLAYLAGVRAMQEILLDAQKTRPQLDASPTTTSLESLIDFWEEYRNGIIKIDNQVWPDESPMHAMAILAVSSTGARRWYWYDPTIFGLIEAYEPELDEDRESQIAIAVERILDDKSSFFQGSQQYATIAVADLTVNPRPDRRLLPATALLIDPREIVHLTSPS